MPLDCFIQADVDTQTRLLMVELCTIEVRMLRRQAIGNGLLCLSAAAILLGYTALAWPMAWSLGVLFDALIFLAIAAHAGLYQWWSWKRRIGQEDWASAVRSKQEDAAAESIWICLAMAVMAGAVHKGALWPPSYESCSLVVCLFMAMSQYCNWRMAKEITRMTRRLDAPPSEPGDPGVVNALDYSSSTILEVYRG